MGVGFGLGAASVPNSKKPRKVLISRGFFAVTKAAAR